MTTTTTTPNSNDNRNSAALAALQMRAAQLEDLTAVTIVAALDLNHTVSDVRRWAINSRHATGSEFDKAVHNRNKREAVITELGAYPETARELVNLYAAKAGIRFSATGVMEYRDTESGRMLDTSIVKQIKHIQEWSANCNFGFSREAIKDSAEIWLDEVHLARHNQIISQLVFDKTVKFDWDRAAKAICVIDEETPLHYVTALLKKFYFDVKRKMARLSVDNHLMLVFVGEQGGGKSSTLKHMFGPALTLSKNVNFSHITDHRYIDIWSTPIMFFDEMGGARLAQMDLVKNAITSETQTFRPMHSNSDIVVAQRSIMIGASNKTLAQLITDTTGIRRFVELRFRNDAEWETINDLDFGDAFRSIDEYQMSDPVLPILDDLKINQERSRNRSAVEEWLEAVHADIELMTRIAHAHSKDDKGKPKELTGIELWNIYRDWRLDNNLPMLPTDTAAPFVKELHNLKRRTGGDKLVFFTPKRKASSVVWTYTGPQAEGKHNPHNRNVVSLSFGRS